MNPKTLLAAALFCAGACAAEPAAEAALSAIRDLGTVNGRALACAETDIATRAKKLMLAHAPKTQTYGDAYQNATQQAYLGQTQSGGACADAQTLSAALDALAQRLDAALPAAR